MKKEERILPHGGGALINRVVSDEVLGQFKNNASKYKVYTISKADLASFNRIADGGLSPLEGPMCSEEFHKVLDEEAIERNGKKYAWTVPIVFPASKEEFQNYAVDETVVVKTEQGEIVGTLEIADIFPFDKNKYNRVVYGTDRIDHPGPRIINSDPREYLIGGKIFALPRPKHSAYGKYLLSPSETREFFVKRGWQRIVAFQTRNALHRAHEYTIVHAMETLTAQGSFVGAVLNPLVGETKRDDVPAYIRMKTYEALIEHKLLGEGDKNEEFWKNNNYDLLDQLVLIGLDIKMFYAGPKEAVMHAIYRQNYGFTDIIIGRKHADAPFDDGTPAWGDFDAHEKFNQLNGELLIKPFNIGFAAYYEELGRVGLVERNKDKGYRMISIAGKELRRKLQNGEVIDERVMRKPVSQILGEYYREKEAKAKNITWHDVGISKNDREQKNGHRGTVIWLTGLSGSGKSTIAVELQAQLFECGCQVFVLDGDNIRHGLNKNLGFSPEDRAENIRRIGEVSKLFSDAGFLVITSFISPYCKDRDQVRSILPEGDFIEIYVQADLAVCEERDPKGLYKKARKGEIKEFTGISAPYERPKKPEIIVNTNNQTKEECAKLITRYLETNKYLSFKDEKR